MGSPGLPEGNNEKFLPDASVKFGMEPFYGARTFRARPDGALTGVTYRQEWLPGINEAMCHKVTGWTIPGVEGLVPEEPVAIERRVWNGVDLSDVTRELVGWTYFDPARGEMVRVLDNGNPIPVRGNRSNKDHSVGQCKSCGWHGFRQGQLSYAYHEDSISGVISAWGTVRIGPKGFRAQYAMIEALYWPLEYIKTEKGSVPGEDESTVTHWGESRSEDFSLALLEKVRQRYSVPVFTDLSLMLSEFPIEPSVEG